MIPSAAQRTIQEPIPGYRLVQRIGAGGYGEVWTAEAPGQLVKAIKFVYGLLDEDRAARELKALNRIKGVRHPFLLSLERIEVVEGQLLIVTELAECSLKDRFEQCRKNDQPGIPRDELLGYLRDAADALDYMNEQHSLQHLDVKPENLLLVGGRIKVADFGLVKDIHDATVSMMGGLTPIYAPPEVFEGRPSRRSDQYSLAIVYQEMLTGVLPFPGRTAAQLAAQHLNAKPRLSALPDHDQPLVARALSKKPTERFASCRELIEALREAPTRAAAIPAPPPPPPPAPGTEPPPCEKGLSAVPAPAAPLSPSAGATPTTPRPVTEMLAGAEAACEAVRELASHEGLPATEVLARPARCLPSSDRRPPAVVSASSGAANPPPPLTALLQMPPLTPAPPPEGAASAAMRPTLFLGLGGWGCKVLMQLKQRLADLAPRPQGSFWPMLGIDTDPCPAAASSSKPSASLAPDELLVVPLRRSQDYRNESDTLLQWLSRRWLYNIPRSQQTEGWRPLGRLALVDHAATVSRKLAERLAAVALAASGAGQPLRVVLVASANGGTGSGMFADVVVLVRQLLDEQPQAGPVEIVGLLLHGTGRQPQQQELARANAVATLTELAHFHGPAGFPGDAACGLKPRSAQQGLLDALYLIDAGDDLSPLQIERWCDQAAEFLFRDAASATSGLLAACRSEAAGSVGLPLRSFGVSYLGLRRDPLVDAAVVQVCRRVLQRLIGPAERPETRKGPRLLAGAGGGTNPSAGDPPPDPLSALQQRSAALARTMGLDVQPLTTVVQQFAAAELGGDPEAFFRSLMVTSPQGEPQVEKWIAAASDLFGRQHTDTSVEGQPGELEEALDRRIGPWVQQVGGGLREWIEAIVDDPQGRIRGARHAARWFQQYLRGLIDRLGEARGQLVRQIESVVHLLAAVEAHEGKPQRRTLQELSTAFLQYCRLRLFELCAQRAGRIAHALQGHTLAAQDALADLEREIEQWAAALPEAELPPATLEEHPLRSAAASKLQAAQETLPQQVEEHLTQTLLAARGGLRALAHSDAASRQTLLDSLQQAARQAVLAEVQTLDLATAVLSAAAGESPLATALKAARPRLARCGGRQRLICLVPPPLTEPMRQALAQQAASDQWAAPAVLPAEAGDLAVLYELGDLSLPHVAAHLLDFRPDLAEAAGRLHTRCDVTWSKLFAV